MLEFTEYTPAQWRNLNLRKLKVDQAYLTLHSDFQNVTYLYSLYENCYTCPFTLFDKLHPEKEISLPINVDYPVKLKVFNRNVGKYALENVNNSSICTFDQIEMNEFGVYNLTVNQNGTCNFVEDKPGVNIYLPIVTIILLIAEIMIIFTLCGSIRKNLQIQKNLVKKVLQKKRMQSLDALRGITIVLMIFVNSGGGLYKQISHIPWNGVHLADFVFPLFVWIMGFCIPLSVKSQLNRNMSKIAICQKMILRSIKLFLIGMWINLMYEPSLTNVRIMGVLQRLAIAYLVGGLTHVTFVEKQQHAAPKERWKRLIFDIILMKWEILISFILISINLAITFGLNIPGCPRGYIGPGGKHSYAAHQNCTGGAAGYIDRVILGKNHLLKGSTVSAIYDTERYESEGLFASILTCVHVFLGIQAGMIYLTHQETFARIRRWMLWSIVLALLGGVLCQFRIENGIIPMNRSLWSLSYVFVTTGLANFLFSILYWIIDVRMMWTGKPLVGFGMNSLLMYVGHKFTNRFIPWLLIFGEMNTHFICLIKTISNMLIWIAIALYFNSQKTYFNL